MADKDEAAASVARDGMVDEVVERLLDKADASGAALLGEDGLLTEITKAVLERALEAEMSEHLGYERRDLAGHGSGNSRNGTSPKTVLTDAGAVTLAVPRDRNGEFEPRLVPKNARQLAGFNDRILSLYARGMSVRDIRSHLAQIYGVEVSPDLISKVTDAVIDELVTWQNRPLDPVWPIICACVPHSVNLTTRTCGNPAGCPFLTGPPKAVRLAAVSGTASTNPSIAARRIPW